jgi:hypothetical protein
LASIRFLVGAGLVIIAIFSLAGIVVLQQLAIQRISGHTLYVTQQLVVTNIVTQYQAFTLSQTITKTITQQLGTTMATATSQASGSYVLIAYSAQTATSVQAPATVYTPHISGYVYLILTVKVENHGYSQVNLSHSDFYVVISGQQYSYAGYIAYTYSWLPTGNVFNGLSVTGNLVYEVPPGYGTFVLFWNHPSNVNVQYVQQ